VPDGHLRQLRHDDQRHPNLSCQTFLRDYYPARVRVEALAHFPIERDLVINMEGFIEKLESIQPYIIPKEPRTLAQGEYLQTPEQLQCLRAVQFVHQLHAVLRRLPAVRSQFRLHRTGGDRLLHRYNVDSRDGGKAERMELVNSEEGVFNCTAVGYCSEVCPKHVDPANAVNQNKTNSAKPIISCVS
jgi:fumarate reductase iron-sulfur subunit